MFGRIIIGLLMVGAGFLVVWKTRNIEDMFGPIDWAEAKLGGGGTNMMYKFIGVVVIFVGFMVMTNLWNAFLEATLGSLFKGVGA
jgi:hypothetical protein